MRCEDCGQFKGLAKNHTCFSFFTEFNKSRTGKNYIDLYGEERAKKIKEKIGNSQKGKHYHTEEHKQKLKEMFKGDSNPAKRLDVRKKMSENHWSKNPLYSSIIRKKVGDTIREFYKVHPELNPLKNPEIAKKVSVKATQTKNKLRKEGKFMYPFDYNEIKLKAQRKAREKPNNIEKKLDSILQTNFPNEYKYVGNAKFWVEGRNPDFINCNGQKKIIELFGRYWHKEGDKGILTEHYLKYGFKTLIIWEDELEEKNISILIKKLNQFNTEGYYDRTF